MRWGGYVRGRLRLLGGGGMPGDRFFLRAYDRFGLAAVGVLAALLCF
jgi:hypothetical protein